jgi:hypothetical protein
MHFFDSTMVTWIQWKLSSLGLQLQIR